MADTGNEGGGDKGEEGAVAAVEKTVAQQVAKNPLRFGGVLLVFFVVAGVASLLSRRGRAFAEKEVAENHARQGEVQDILPGWAQ